jgi:hypothetical protein
MELEIIMLSKARKAKKQDIHVFTLTLNLDLK